MVNEATRQAIGGIATIAITAVLSKSGSGEKPPDTEEPLEADFTWQPSEPLEDEVVTLNADVSSGDVVSYTWDIMGEVLTGQTVQFTSSEEGEVDVSLTVEDSDGNIDTISVTIPIEPGEEKFGLGDYGESGFGGPT